MYRHVLLKWLLIQLVSDVPWISWCARYHSFISFVNHIPKNCLKLKSNLKKSVISDCEIWDPGKNCRIRKCKCSYPEATKFGFYCRMRVHALSVLLRMPLLSGTRLTGKNKVHFYIRGDWIHFSYATKRQKGGRENEHSGCYANGLLGIVSFHKV
jgi:hypothetical protein